jgi:hypothetical protein
MVADVKVRDSMKEVGLCGPSRAWSAFREALQDQYQWCMKHTPTHHSLPSSLCTKVLMAVFPKMPHYHCMRLNLQPFATLIMLPAWCMDERMDLRPMLPKYLTLEVYDSAWQAICHESKLATTIVRANSLETTLSTPIV